MQPRRISPTTVIAVLALFIALGGSAIAASHHFVITSTKQIKPSVLKKLRRAGPRGATGATGVQGPVGGTGTQGPQGPGATTLSYDATASASPSEDAIGTILGETLS